MARLVCLGLVVFWFDWKDTQGMSRTNDVTIACDHGCSGYFQDVARKD